MKNLIKKFLLVFLAIFISVLVAELFVRAYQPQKLIYYNNDVWRPDSTFGWRHYENANTVVNTGGEGLVSFRTDENGFRINVDQEDQALNGDEFSILILGDSFIAGLQVENEKTVPEVLKSHILSKYDLDLVVYNAAVNGWDPNQYYLEAKRVLAEKKIDLGIVFIYTANDFVKSVKTSYSPEQVAQRHKFSIPDSLSWSSLRDSFFYPINDFFEVRSHLFILLKTRLETMLSKLGLTAYYFPDVHYLSEKSSARWEITAGISKSIYEEFQAYNTPVIFVILPAVYQVHEEMFNHYIEGFDIPVDAVDLEQPNKLLKSHLDGQSITILDPLMFMRERADSKKSYYGKIDRHFNESGHKIVAEFIFPEVEKYLPNSEN